MDPLYYNRDNNNNNNNNADVVIDIREEDDQRVFGPNLTTIPTGDPIFKQIAEYCYQNSSDYPYYTDFFQETKPVMKGFLSRNPLEVAKGLYQQSGNLLKKNVGNRPRFVICKIKAIGNGTLWERFLAKRQLMLEHFNRSKLNLPEIPISAPKIKSMIGNLSAPVIDPSINECYLFSGHKKSIIKSIVESGAKPHIGGYDQTKGYGALGKGAYYTDRVDKAISYSPCSTCGETANPCNPDMLDGRRHYRRIVLNRVILGRSLVLKDGSEVRHSSNNEMVFHEIPGVNEKIKPEGEDAVDLSHFQSVIGEETYSSGGSMIEALYHRNNFDSNEFMVRNGDQVYPEFIIYYTIKADNEIPFVEVVLHQ